MLNINSITFLYKDSSKTYLNSERYYLRAVPVAQITAYQDKGFTLTQNPDW